MNNPLSTLATLGVIVKTDIITDTDMDSMMESLSNIKEEDTYWHVDAGFKWYAENYDAAGIMDFGIHGDGLVQAQYMACKKNGIKYNDTPECFTVCEAVQRMYKYIVTNWQLDVNSQ